MALHRLTLSIISTAFVFFIISCLPKLAPSQASWDLTRRMYTDVSDRNSELNNIFGLQFFGKFSPSKPNSEPKTRHRRKKNHHRHHYQNKFYQPPILQLVQPIYQPPTQPTSPQLPPQQLPPNLIIWPFYYDDKPKKYHHHKPKPCVPGRKGWPECCQEGDIECCDPVTQPTECCPPGDCICNPNGETCCPASDCTCSLPDNCDCFPEAPNCPEPNLCEPWPSCCARGNTVWPICCMTGKDPWPECCPDDCDCTTGSPICSRKRSGYHRNWHKDFSNTSSAFYWRN